MFIYAALGLILSLATMFALFTAGQTLSQGLWAGASERTVVEVIDRLLVVLLLLEILHTVRISLLISKFGEDAISRQPSRKCETPVGD